MNETQPSRGSANSTAIGISVGPMAIGKANVNANCTRMIVKRGLAGRIEPAAIGIGE